MVQDTVIKFAEMAVKKRDFLNKSVMRYFMLSVLAGLYVGLGIVLIFSIGGPMAVAEEPGLKALMGASFGIALTLVIFAGSELFTGNNMTMTIGLLAKKTSFWDLIKIWVVCYIGNLVGALFLSGLISAAGVFHSDPLNEPLIVKTALIKGTYPFWIAFIKAFLCNLLVCLAVWTSARTENDMAKIALIFWCLFGFIGSGYEHSIANMTVLGVSSMISQSVTVGHFIHNMIPATLGNITSGVFLGAIYWFISNKDM